MATISCIIPVYNAEKYLRHCLDSVLSQTFTDYEVILVNDGSTDGSEKICNEYAIGDSRVKVVNKLNGGVSSARNLGIDIASGKFVCFVDADDVIPNSCFKVLVDFAKHDDCGAVAGRIGSKTLDSEKKHKQEQAKEINTWDEFCRAVNKGFFCTAYAALFSRKILIDYGIRFNERIRYGEDSLFNIEYFAVVKSAIILSSVVYYYFIHDESSSHKYYLDGAVDNWVLWFKSLFLCFKHNRIPECETRCLIVDKYLGIYVRLTVNACSSPNRLDMKSEITQVEKKYLPLVCVSGNEKMRYLRTSNKREGLLYLLVAMRAFWFLRLMKQIKRGLMQRG